MLQKGTCKLPAHRDHQVFRRRFGVTFARFKSIVETARTWTQQPDKPDSKKFGESKTDAVGNPSVPLELKILGALRINAKGCSFDAIAELTGMALSTMATFYHLFWRRFVEELKEEWIAYPKDPAQAATSMEVYRRLGFPGAVGSVDCTHVHWARCPMMKQSTHTGKEKYPTLSYEVTCAHNRRILYVTCGHPGARNDKTIVKSDEFVQSVHRKLILSDVKFTMYRLDGTTYELQGAYFITDNGYHKVGVRY
jgi:hypothetical protein